MTVTNPYPVDSAARTCCGGIGRHTRYCSAVHRITDHPAIVHTADSGIILDQIDHDLPLNSDQARELASALLVAAAEVDGWVQR
ncbi:hypothetical protein [Mycolicibacterium gilvum]|uniref:Uncharacterized protein n=1 Tax=Mycolicibacterium gilvum TaxID=1804 RepID=A0A378SL76_9MYCO|nr:hypothetical protein [Mycolicibacterium gilvum]STZ43562.1 Uncharacterised protein [Mycolicibacterium gilvum]